MHRFSTPDEIFGPISIKKLKDEDKYERLTERYLPGSNIVFLDEIWKAGPSIQNALLTVLNEKLYRNGEQEVKVKLRGIISASNELPAEDQGLEALWDRFLVRYVINNIAEVKNFLTMVTATEDLYADPIPEAEKVNEQELGQWSKEIDKIQVPVEVLDLIGTLRVALEEHNKNSAENKVYVSDRRWKKTIHIIRASAFLNGRMKVDLMDCFLIIHTIWERPDQFSFVSQLVAER